jgi:hypothetical protein
MGGLTSQSPTGTSSSASILGIGVYLGGFIAFADGVVEDSFATGTVVGPGCANGFQAPVAPPYAAATRPARRPLAALGAPTAFSLAPTGTSRPRGKRSAASTRPRMCGASPRHRCEAPPPSSVGTSDGVADPAQRVSDAALIPNRSVFIVVFLAFRAGPSARRVGTCRLPFAPLARPNEALSDVLSSGWNSRKVPRPSGRPADGGQRPTSAA